MKKGEKATEEEFIEYCHKRLASYKKPASIDLVEALPRNSAGKVLKNELRAKYWEGNDRKI